MDPWIAPVPRSLRPRHMKTTVLRQHTLRPRNCVRAMLEARLVGSQWEIRYKNKVCWPHSDILFDQKETRTNFGSHMPFVRQRDHAMSHSFVTAKLLFRVSKDKQRCSPLSRLVAKRFLVFKVSATIGALRQHFALAQIRAVTSHKEKQVRMNDCRVLTASCAMSRIKSWREATSFLFRFRWKHTKESVR